MIKCPPKEEIGKPPPLSPSLKKREKDKGEREKKRAYFKWRLFSPLLSERKNKMSLIFLRVLYSSFF